MPFSDHLESLSIGAIAGLAVATPVLACVVPERGGMTLLGLHFGIAALGGVMLGAAHLFGRPEQLKKLSAGLAFAVAAGTMFAYAPTEKRLQQQEQDVRQRPSYAP